MLNVFKPYCKYIRIQKTYVEFCFKSLDDYKALRSALLSRSDSAFVVACFPLDLVFRTDAYLVFKISLHDWMRFVSCSTCGFIPYRVKDSKGNLHLKSIMYVNR